MLDEQLEIVRFAIALHIGAAPETIHLDHHLEEDLGLDPLDLVLVVLRLEEIEEAEFPVADLEHAVRVRDLVAIVRRWSKDAEQLDASLETIPAPSTPSTPSRPPMRRASGMHPRVSNDAVKKCVAG